MIISKKFIPSLFTILNAFCGFMSCINSANGEFEHAVLFIFYGAIFDMLDGIVARMLNSASDFGVELDSLSDVITFGFAPAYLAYNFYFKDYDAIGLAICGLFLAFAALRLARFNVELTGYSKDVFFGLPTPMATLVLCSYILFIHNNVLDEELSNTAIFVITIGSSLLMITKIRFLTTPPINKKSLKQRPFLFIILAVSLAAAIITKGKAVFALSLLYVLHGIIRSLVDIIIPKRRVRKSKA